MFNNTLAKLSGYLRNLCNIFKEIGSDKVVEQATSCDASPQAQQVTSGNIPLQTPAGAPRYNISKAANELAKSGEFQFNHFEDQDKQSWVFKKPIRLIGDDYTIQIEVSENGDLLTFRMPMYGKGTEGLTSDKLKDIATFDALIIQFNSRIKGGSFTKDTDDNSDALVFIDHFPSSRMDTEWFKSILDHFVKVLIGFRPEFDKAITTLDLKRDPNAGLMSLATAYLLNDMERTRDHLGNKSRYNLLDDAKH
jgi:hypothetical protein